jgi:hypothetical protein
VAVRCNDGTGRHTGLEVVEQCSTLYQPLGMACGGDEGGLEVDLGTVEGILALLKC